MTKRSKSPTSSMAFEQAEKACSKVIYAGETLIDLTADTVSAEHLEEGYTAHDRAGNSIVGTLQVPKSVQPKDINFYDYDGTLIDSWTFDDLYHASDLPPNPSHDGLIAQGWNWTLLDLITKVYTQRLKMNVGQMYVTSDGKTRAYITIYDTARSSIIVHCQSTVSGGVTIDWGDGSEVQTTSGTGYAAYPHTYTQAGDYVISFTVNSGELILGSNGTEPFVSGNVVGYGNTVKELRLGTGITTIGGGMCYNCYSLTSITIPNTVTSMINMAFSACYSLACVVLPSNLESISPNAFSNCSSLTVVSFPDGLSALNSQIFNGCYRLKSAPLPPGITSLQQAFMNCYSLLESQIPSSLSSIGIGTYNNCYSLSAMTIPATVQTLAPSVFSGCRFIKEYHLKKATPPTMASTSVFSGIADDCIMYVPKGSLQAYQTATNWSVYADYMQEEAE